MSPRAETQAAGAVVPGLPAEREWIENAPREGWLPRPDLRELWRERELALVLARKDLKVRYQQTFFGVAWALLQPLIAALIFTIVFGRAADLATDGIPYPVFVYTGLTVWLYFSASVAAAAASMVDNRDLISKVYFPRLLAPSAAMLPGLVDLAISLPIIALFMVIWGVAPTATVLLVPAWVLAALVAAFATGTLLAALNVRYRDVRFALPFLLQVWLFATPVVYPITLIEGAWRWVYALNPMATIVTGFRWSIAGGAAPGPEAAVSAVVVLVTLVAGLLYFNHVERSFADEI